MNKPPRSLLRWLDELGMAGTTRFLAAFGGRDVLWVPAHIPTDHPISIALDDERLVAKMESLHGGTYVRDIPTMRGLDRHIAYSNMVQMADSGHSAPVIAQRHGCTTRWVRYILSKARSGEPTKPEQLTLLD